MGPGAVVTRPQTSSAEEVATLSVVCRGASLISAGWTTLSECCSIAKLHQASHVVQLDLTGNQLVDLDVSEYVLLRSLTAAHNLLTEPLLWQTLPQTLTHLDVSYNTLAALPTLRGLPHLRILNVAHNRLQDVRGAAECPTLHVLLAGGNRVRALDGLQALAELHTLQLHNNRIKGELQLRQLSLNRALRSLRLEGNPVSKNAGAYKACVRQVLPQLDALDGTQLHKSRYSLMVAALPNPVPSTPAPVKQYARREDIERATEVTVTLPAPPPLHELVRTAVDDGAFSTPPQKQRVVDNDVDYAEAGLATLARLPNPTPRSSTRIRMQQHTPSAEAVTPAGADGSQLSAITAIAEADFSPLRWAELEPSSTNYSMSSINSGGAVGAISNASAQPGSSRTPARSSPLSSAAATPALPRALDRELDGLAAHDDGTLAMWLSMACESPDEVPSQNSSDKALVAVSSSPVRSRRSTRSVGGEAAAGSLVLASPTSLVPILVSDVPMAPQHTPVAFGSTRSHRRIAEEQATVRPTPIHGARLAWSSQELTNAYRTTPPREHTEGFSVRSTETTPVPRDPLQLPGATPVKEAVVAAFWKFDYNGTGALRLHQLKAAMADAGVLRGAQGHRMDDSVADALVREVLWRLEKGSEALDHHIDFQTFATACQTALLLRDNAMCNNTMDVDAVGRFLHHGGLRRAFASACRHADPTTAALSCSRFVQFCRRVRVGGRPLVGAADAPLPSSVHDDGGGGGGAEKTSEAHLSVQTLDLVFTRARPKTSRHLAFIDFLRALQLLARHMRCPLPELVSAVVLLDPGEPLPVRKSAAAARIESANSFSSSRRFPAPTAAAAVPVVHVKVSGHLRQSREPCEPRMMLSYRERDVAGYRSRARPGTAPEATTSTRAPARRPKATAKGGKATTATATAAAVAALATARAVQTSFPPRRTRTGRATPITPEQQQQQQEEAALVQSVTRSVVKGVMPRYTHATDGRVPLYEAVCVLAELGALDPLLARLRSAPEGAATVQRLGRAVHDVLRRADGDGDGLLDADDVAAACVAVGVELDTGVLRREAHDAMCEYDGGKAGGFSLPNSKPMPKLPIPPVTWINHAELFARFRSLCSPPERLEGPSPGPTKAPAMAVGAFTTLCVAAALLPPQTDAEPVRRVAAALVFAAVRPKGRRTIKFLSFLQALAVLAAQLRLPPAHVLRAVLRTDVERGEDDEAAAVAAQSTPPRSGAANGERPSTASTRGSSSSHASWLPESSPGKGEWRVHVERETSPDSKAAVRAVKAAVKAVFRTYAATALPDSQAISAARCPEPPALLTEHALLQLCVDCQLVAPPDAGHDDEAADGGSAAAASRLSARDVRRIFVQCAGGGGGLRYAAFARCLGELASARGGNSGGGGGALGLAGVTHMAETILNTRTPRVMAALHAYKRALAAYPPLTPVRKAALLCQRTVGDGERAYIQVEWRWLPKPRRQQLHTAFVFFAGGRTWVSTAAAAALLTELHVLWRLPSRAASAAMCAVLERAPRAPATTKRLSADVSGAEAAATTTLSWVGRRLDWESVLALHDEAVQDGAWVGTLDETLGVSVGTLWEGVGEHGDGSDALPHAALRSAFLALATAPSVAAAVVAVSAEAFSAALKACVGRGECGEVAPLGDVDFLFAWALALPTTEGGGGAGGRRGVMHLEAFAEGVARVAAVASLKPKELVVRLLAHLGATSSPVPSPMRPSPECKRMRDGGGGSSSSSSAVMFAHHKNSIIDTPTRTPSVLLEATTTDSAAAASTATTTQSSAPPSSSLPRVPPSPASVPPLQSSSAENRPSSGGGGGATVSAASTVQHTVERLLQSLHRGRTGARVPWEAAAAALAAAGGLGGFAPSQLSTLLKAPIAASWRAANDTHVGAADVAEWAAVLAAAQAHGTPAAGASPGELAALMEPWLTHAELHSVFLAFCDEQRAGGDTLSRDAFLHLCRECALMDVRMVTAMDLVFAAAVAAPLGSSERDQDYDEGMGALGFVETVRALAVVAADVGKRVGADPAAQMDAVVQAVLREGTEYLYGWQEEHGEQEQERSRDGSFHAGSGMVTPPDPGSPYRWHEWSRSPPEATEVMRQRVEEATEVMRQRVEEATEVMRQRVESQPSALRGTMPSSMGDMADGAFFGHPGAAGYVRGVAMAIEETVEASGGRGDAEWAAVPRP